MYAVNQSIKALTGGWLPEVANGQAYANTYIATMYMEVATQTEQYITHRFEVLKGILYIATYRTYMCIHS